MRTFVQLLLICCSVLPLLGRADVVYTEDEQRFIQQHRQQIIPFFSVYSRRYEPDAALVDSFIDILNRDSGLTFKARYDSWNEAYNHIHEYGMSVISRITDIPSRREKLLFTDSYFDRPLFYLTMREIDCCNENSFAGKEIASITNAYFTDELKALGAKVFSVPTIETLLYELISKKYEGVIADWSDISSLRQELNDTFRLNLVEKINIHQIPNDLITPSRLSLAVNKQDKELFSIINKHFLANREQLAQIAQRAAENLTSSNFIPLNASERNFITQHPNPVICFPFDSPPMIAKTPSGQLGNSYVANIMKEIESHLELTFEYKDVEFNNYVSAMTSNECHAFIVAEAFAKQLGLASAKNAILKTEIVLLSNIKDTYYTSSDLIKDLKVGSVGRVLLDSFDIAFENSLIAPLPILLDKLQKREIDAIAMIREQAGFLIATKPDMGITVIANSGIPYRFVISSHPRFATAIDIIDRGLKKVSQGFLNQQYRKTMAILPASKPDNTALIAVSLALIFVVIIASLLVLKSRRRVSEQTRLAQMQNDFLSNMSHELRTPLNGVLGIFQILEDENLPDDVKALVDVGLQSSRSLSMLINDILDYDKLNQGKVKFTPQPTQIKSLLQQVIHLNSHQAHEKSLYINLDIEESVPSWLLLDPIRFEQLANNIINNAIKFTNQGGLTIQVSYAANQLDISFVDTGIGMSKELQAVLFNRFSQGNDTKTTSFRGTGLGMSICKELCQLMDGNISVKSTVDVGTTVLITLPADVAQASFLENKELPPLDPMHILCVDDESNTLQVTSALLKKLGMSYRLAENGVEAINEVRKQQFDVILMDINMPVMGGIEFLSEYRRQGGSTPVVAFTANAMDEDIKRYLGMGFSDVLTKPLAYEKLHACLKQYN